MTTPPILPGPGPVLQPEPDPGEVAQEAGFSPSHVPCVIYLANGKSFHVAKVDAWGYVPQGIFATGYFRDELPEREVDILIHETRVDYIELDFPALKRHIAAQSDDASPGS